MNLEKFIEKKFGPAFQSQLYSNGSKVITSKDKKIILLKQLKEDLKIANTINSTLNSQLQDILDLRDKCKCCRCNM